LWNGPSRPHEAARALCRLASDDALGDAIDTHSPPKYAGGPRACAWLVAYGTRPRTPHAPRWHRSGTAGGGVWKLAVMVAARMQCECPPLPTPDADLDFSRSSASLVSARLGSRQATPHAAQRARSSRIDDGIPIRRMAHAGYNLNQAVRYAARRGVGVREKRNDARLQNRITEHGTNSRA
jgi:hypothetical protein